jgi:hypothetical protein
MAGVGITMPVTIKPACAVGVAEPAEDRQQTRKYALQFHFALA